MLTAECGNLPRSHPPGLDRMLLHEVEVRGRHGASERRAGQRFVIDAEWWLDTGMAVTTDQLDRPVCYKQIHDCLVAVPPGEPWQPIGSLADCVTRTLLARFPPLRIVTVTVHKPEAPIGGVFADVGITMPRPRNRIPAPTDRT